MTPDRTLRTLERGRANNFDFLRVAFALLVILSHSYPAIQKTEDFEPLYVVTGHQQTFGQLAVEGFFLISGYLIAMSWQRSRSLVDYLRRRALRIVPGFLVAVMFSSLVAGPLWPGDRSNYWRDFDARRFLIDAFNLQGAYAPIGPAVNGSLWSIRYEFCCYLALAALGLMGLLRLRPLVLLGALGCTSIYAAQLHFHIHMPGSRLSWLWCYPGFWPRVAAVFLAGTAFHLYADRVVHSARLALAAALGLVLAAAYPPAKALPLVLPYLGGYLVFYFAFASAGPIKDIARRGDLTYGLYLYAYPIQFLLAGWYGSRLSPLGLFAIAAPTTALFAAASWHLIERPCLQLKRAVRPQPSADPVVERPAEEPAVP